MSEDEKWSSSKLFCPECGGEMDWEGYRSLFPTCTECGETFHVEKCKRE